MGNLTKKAILVVSFGTSHEDTRKVTIDAIEETIGAAFPQYRIYRAWTSKMIIAKLKKRDGIIIHTVKEAMEQMIADGIREVAVQPTHILDGIENNIMKEEVLSYKESFDKIAFGTPLLADSKDESQAINAVTTEFSDLKETEALVFMGHGTSHTANVTYDQMQTQMENLGLKNAFIGTVEGKPEDTACDKVIEKVKEAGYKNVVLRPLMVVAGDHANNDMAGDDEDSWKSQFVASGNFDKVDCQIEGLGRIEAVEKLYVEHTKAAIDSLGSTEESADSDAAADTEADSAEESAE